MNHSVSIEQNNDPGELKTLVKLRKNNGPGELKTLYYRQLILKNRQKRYSLCLYNTLELCLHSRHRF